MNTLSMSKAQNVFQELMASSPSTSTTFEEWQLWMLHAAHSMMKLGQITQAEFAIIMDEVCSS